MLARELAENLVQGRWTQLGSATRGFYGLREAEWFYFGHGRHFTGFPGGGVLLRGDVGDLDVGILTVPLRGDAFEGQAEGLPLTGAQWGDTEVDCFGIWACGFQNLHGDVFALG